MDRQLIVRKPHNCRHYIRSHSLFSSSSSCYTFKTFRHSKDIDNFLVLQNMKQKIVIKVHVICDKCRTKALKVAAVADCVISVALEGEDKDQVVVIGDGVDAASLVCSLRKKVGYARLVSVEEEKVKVEVEVKEEKEKEKEEAECSGVPICYQPHCELLYKVVYEPYPSDCTIL